LQISTKKNASQTEELLGLEQRVYKKPALLISFGEEGVVNQEGQYWQTNKNEEGVDRIDSLPYAKPYQEDATGKVEIDNAQRENTRTFFPLKKDFFDGFFGGSVNKLPIQVGTDINENIKENKEALINALLLNLVNNNANINFKNLKKVKKTGWLQQAKQAIQKAEDLGLDTTRYEKKLSVLEKEAYMNDIIDCFTKSDKYPDTTTFKEALIKHLKKGLSLGITNDELNTKLISFVGQAIEDQQKAYKITLEKNQPNKKHILNYHSKEIKFLEDQLKEIKENPIDFTVFLDDQA